MFTFCKKRTKKSFLGLSVFSLAPLFIVKFLLPFYIRPFLYPCSILPLMPNYISVSPINIYALSGNISNLSKQLPYFINTIFCNYNENAFGSALVRFDTTLHFIFEKKRVTRKDCDFCG